jgi:hypothetical protein
MLWLELGQSVLLDRHSCLDVFLKCKSFSHLLSVFELYSFLHVWLLVVGHPSIENLFVHPYLWRQVLHFVVEVRMLWFHLTISNSFFHVSRKVVEVLVAASLPKCRLCFIITFAWHEVVNIAFWVSVFVVIWKILSVVLILLFWLYTLLFRLGGVIWLYPFSQCIQHIYICILLRW